MKTILFIDLEDESPRAVAVMAIISYSIYVLTKCCDQMCNLQKSHKQLSPQVFSRIKMFVHSSNVLVNWIKRLLYFITIYHHITNYRYCCNQENIKYLIYFITHKTHRNVVRILDFYCVYKNKISKESLLHTYTHHNIIYSSIKAVVIINTCSLK